MSDVPFIELADGTTKKLTDKQLALVRRGAELTRLLKDQKKELDGINDQLKKSPGVGVSIVLPNEVRVPISEVFTDFIADPDGLKTYLGTRVFNQLVKSTTSYKTTDALLDKAYGDDADENVSDYLDKKRSEAVKYLPIKTKV